MQLIQHPVSLKATALGFVIYDVLIIVQCFAVSAFSFLHIPHSGIKVMSRLCFVLMIFSVRKRTKETFRDIEHSDIVIFTYDTMLKGMVLLIFKCPKNILSSPYKPASLTGPDFVVLILFLVGIKNNGNSQNLLHDDNSCVRT